MRAIQAISLLGLVCGTTYASRAPQVYLIPSDPTLHHDPPSLSPYAANRAIAHHLGLEQSEAVGDGEWWDAVKSNVGEGSKDAVLLVVQSDHPEGALCSFISQVRG